MTRKKWLRGLGWVSLFLTILTFVITVTINAYPLYVWEISNLNILDYVPLSKEALLENYRQLMTYLNVPWVNPLTMTDFPVSSSGAFHFYEVKKLFMLNYGVLLVTIVPTVLFLRQLNKERGLWRLVRPFQIGALIPVVLGFLMLTSFDWFFETFHGVFFNNDAWIFDPSTDPIIMALPAEYFMHCFALAFILLEICFIGGIYAGKRSLKH